MSEPGYKLSDEDIEALRRLHDVCGKEMLPWTITFWEGCCEYEVEAGMKDWIGHAYCKKSGTLAHGIERVLNDLEEQWKTLAAKQGPVGK